MGIIAPRLRKELKLIDSIIPPLAARTVIRKRWRHRQAQLLEDLADPDVLSTDDLKTVVTSV